MAFGNIYHVKGKQDNTVKEIDKKLIETINRYVASGIEQQVDYEKFYLYSLITHSTAIEGSTVTEVENQLLFDEGIVAKGRSLVEQMMNVDLKDAYLFGFDWAKRARVYTYVRLAYSCSRKNVAALWYTDTKRYTTIYY